MSLGITPEQAYYKFLEMGQAINATPLTKDLRSRVYTVFNQALVPQLEGVTPMEVDLEETFTQNPSTDTVNVMNEIAKALLQPEAKIQPDHLLTPILYNEQFLSVIRETSAQLKEEMGAPEYIELQENLEKLSKRWLAELEKSPQAMNQLLEACQRSPEAMISLLANSEIQPHIQQFVQTRWTNLFQFMKKMGQQEMPEWGEREVNEKTLKELLTWDEKAREVSGKLHEQILSLRSCFSNVMIAGWKKPEDLASRCSDLQTVLSSLQDPAAIDQDRCKAIKESLQKGETALTELANSLKTETKELVNQIKTSREAKPTNKELKEKLNKLQEAWLSSKPYHKDQKTYLALNKRILNCLDKIPTSDAIASEDLISETQRILVDGFFGLHDVEAVPMLPVDLLRWCVPADSEKPMESLYVSVEDIDVAEQFLLGSRNKGTEQFFASPTPIGTEIWEQQVQDLNNLRRNFIINKVGQANDAARWLAQQGLISQEAQISFEAFANSPELLSKIYSQEVFDAELKELNKIFSDFFRSPLHDAHNWMFERLVGIRKAIKWGWEPDSADQATLQKIELLCAQEWRFPEVFPELNAMVENLLPILERFRKYGSMKQQTEELISRFGAWCQSLATRSDVHHWMKQQFLPNIIQNIPKILSQLEKGPSVQAVPQEAQPTPSAVPEEVQPTPTPSAVPEAQIPPPPPPPPPPSAAPTTAAPTTAAPKEPSQGLPVTARRPARPGRLGQAAKAALAAKLPTQAISGVQAVPEEVQPTPPPSAAPKAQPLPGPSATATPARPQAFGGTLTKPTPETKPPAPPPISEPKKQVYLEQVDTTESKLKELGSAIEFLNKEVRDYDATELNIPTSELSAERNQVWDTAQKCIRDIQLASRTEEFFSAVHELRTCLAKRMPKFEKAKAEFRHKLEERQKRLESAYRQKIADISMHLQGTSLDKNQTLTSMRELEQYFRSVFTEPGTLRDIESRLDMLEREISIRSSPLLIDVQKIQTLEMERLEQVRTQYQNLITERRKQATDLTAHSAEYKEAFEQFVNEYYEIDQECKQVLDPSLVKNEERLQKIKSNIESTTEAVTKTLQKLTNALNKENQSSLDTLNDLGDSLSKALKDRVTERGENASQTLRTLQEDLQRLANNGRLKLSNATNPTAAKEVLESISQNLTEIKGKIEEEIKKDKEIEAQEGKKRKEEEKAAARPPESRKRQREAIISPAISQKRPRSVSPGGKPSAEPPSPQGEKEEIPQELLVAVCGQQANYIQNLINANKDYLLRNLFATKETQKIVFGATILKIRLRDGKPELIVKQFFDKGTFNKVYLVVNAAGKIFSGFGEIVVYRKPLEKGELSPSDIQKEADVSKESRGEESENQAHIIDVHLVTHIKDPSRPKGQILTPCLADCDQSGKNLTERLSQKVLLRLAYCAADGLAHMHRKGWCHLDFSPRNFLIKRDEEGQIIGLVADFGNAAKMNEAYEKLGTLPYSAPEVFKPVKISSEKVDAWSLGLLILELVHGREANRFLFLNEGEFTENNAAWKDAYTTIHDNLDDKDPIDQVILSLIKQEPKQRASPEDVREVLLKLYNEQLTQSPSEGQPRTEAT